MDMMIVIVVLIVMVVMVVTLTLINTGCVNTLKLPTMPRTPARLLCVCSCSLRGVDMTARCQEEEKYGRPGLSAIRKLKISFIVLYQETCHVSTDGQMNSQIVYICISIRMHTYVQYTIYICVYIHIYINGGWSMGLL